MNSLGTQNHRITERLRLADISRGYLVQSLALAGSPRDICPWPSPDSLWISPKTETLLLLWATSASSGSLSQLRCSEGFTCVSGCYHCLCSWPWTPLTKKPGFILFGHSICVFIHTDKISLSLLFYRLSSPSSLIHLYVRCSSPLIILVALCWTLSRMSMFLLY